MRLASGAAHLKSRLWNALAERIALQRMSSPAALSFLEAGRGDTPRSVHYLYWGKFEPVMKMKHIGHFVTINFREIR